MSANLPDPYSERYEVMSPIDYGAAAHELYREGEIREGAAKWGEVDTLLATAVVPMPMLTIGEMVQTERQSYAAKGMEYLVDGASGPLEWLATNPLDNKAIAVAAATYGLASVARRIRRRDRFEIDSDQAIAAIAGAESYNPAPARMYRIKRRIGDALLTAASVTLAYKLGEQGTLEQDAVATTAIAATTYATIGATKLRAALYSRRRQQSY